MTPLASDGATDGALLAGRSVRGLVIAMLTALAASCQGVGDARFGPAKRRSATDSTTQPAAKIDSFDGPYRFLSNFSPAEVKFEGMTYPSVEHAYQAAKSLDLAERRRIAALPTPSEAKKAGQQLALRPGWETAKFQVMEECVRCKFTHHAELRELLLATGDAYLEEGNTWGDRVWGVYQGQGENRLGMLLMKVREELRSER